MTLVDSIPEDGLQDVLHLVWKDNSLQPFVRMPILTTAPNPGQQQLLVSTTAVSVEDDIKLLEIALNELETKVWQRGFTETTDANVSSITCAFDHRRDSLPCDLDTSSELSSTSCILSETNIYRTKADLYWECANNATSPPTRVPSEPVRAAFSVHVPENCKQHSMPESATECTNLGMSRVASCPLVMDKIQVFVPRSPKCHSLKLKYL
jgi:hypothetical protein